MKTYTGGCPGGQRSVTVEGRPLRAIYPKEDRRSFPFEWGKESPGSEHLAQAILSDHNGDKPMRLYARAFMIEVVSKLPTGWDIKSGDIGKWLKLKNLVGQSVQKACSAPAGSPDPPPPAEPLRPTDFPNFPVDPLKSFGENLRKADTQAFDRTSMLVQNHPAGH